MDIGTTIERKREKRGISFAELARRTRINEDMVARFCKGKSMPKGDQLIRICIELDLDVDDFDKVEEI